MEIAKETKALLIQNIQTLAETEQPSIEIEGVDEESIRLLSNEFKKSVIKNTKESSIVHSTDVSGSYAKPVLDLSEYDLPGFK
jgi:hypothetical protein